MTPRSKRKGTKQGDDDDMMCSKTYLMGISSHGYTKRASQPEISELEVVILVNQQILGLQVSVEDPMRVTVKQPRVQLMGEFLSFKVQEIIISACKEEGNIGAKT